MRSGLNRKRAFTPLELKVGLGALLQLPHSLRVMPSESTEHPSALGSGLQAFALG